MSHDPERDAAAYLSGTMRARRESAFERHLLTCEDCWREVEEGRRGRAFIEDVREMAPTQMREDLRAAVAAREPLARKNIAVWLAAAAALVVLSAGTTTLVLVRSPRQPAAIAEAVADFRTGRLPVVHGPTRPAPDLSDAGLTLVSAGSGNVGTLGVDAYAYRDANGAQLLLYLSEHPFPVATGAVRGSGPGAPWTARDGNVQLLCAQRPHALLLLSLEAAVLQRAASALGVG